MKRLWRLSVGAALLLLAHPAVADFTVNPPITFKSGYFSKSGASTVDGAHVGTAGTYAFPSSVTTDVFGRVTAITAGSVGCSGLTPGGILFVNGSGTCTVDGVRFFWDSTLHGQHIKGGDSSGYSVFIQSDYDVIATGTLKIGFNLLHQAGVFEAIDSSGNPSLLSLNPGKGPVGIGTDLATFSSAPAGATSSLVGTTGLNTWATQLGVANAFRGGLRVNANSLYELRFYDVGLTERTKISGDPATPSFLPSRTASVGFTDSTLLSCGGVTTNGSGDLTCIGGGGSGSLGGNNSWSGTNVFSNTTTFTSVLGTIVTEATTARTLLATDCGKLIRFTNGSAITATVPNSLPAGCNIAGMQIGAGQVTVAAGAGATFLANPHLFTKSFGVNAVFGITVDTNSGGTAATFTFVGDGA